MSDRIIVKPNTTYIFSAWGKTNGAGGNSTPAVRVVEKDVNDKFIVQTDVPFRRGTSNWTQKKITFKTRINTSYVYVYANIWKGYGTFWFDDVELHEERTDNNLIPNGGFEKDVDIYLIPKFLKTFLFHND